jgi:hypothetical protein
MQQSNQMNMAESSDRQREVVGKLWRRILWFVALLLLCAQIDEQNIVSFP